MIKNNDHNDVLGKNNSIQFNLKFDLAFSLSIHFNFVITFVWLCPKL